MESINQHKKILGIIYIVTASLFLLLMLGVNMFISTLFEFISDKANEDDAALVLDMVGKLVMVITWCIGLFISVPSIIAGIGLLNQQRWAMVMALILGCFKLLSFPIGTAIGVYSIWVYTESNRVEKELQSQPK